MIKERERMKKRQVKPLLRRTILKQRLFSLPDNVTLDEAKRSLKTVVFVRNPLDRLASAYYEKLFRKNFR